MDGTGTDVREAQSSQELLDTAKRIQDAEFSPHQFFHRWAGEYANRIVFGGAVLDTPRELLLLSGVQESRTTASWPVQQSLDAATIVPGDPLLHRTPGSAGDFDDLRAGHPSSGEPDGLDASCQSTFRSRAVQRVKFLDTVTVRNVHSGLHAKKTKQASTMNRIGYIWPSALT